MELRHLRYFVAVAQEQNVTRAATKLHVSQPPLSRQIRALEEELGVVLFHRSANAVQLSDAGRRFLIDAKAIIRQASEAAKNISSFGKYSVPKIRIGHSAMVSSDLLPKLLRRFKEVAPEAQVKLSDMSAQQLSVAVQLDSIDLALTVQSRIALPRKLRFEALRTYRAGVLVPSGHRLAGTNSVELSNLVDEQLVTPSIKEYTNYHHFLRSVFRETRSKPRIAHECAGLASLLASIVSGYGVAIMFELPKHLRPGIEFLPFKHTVEPMIIGILYRDETHSPLVSALIKAANSLGASRAALKKIAHSS
jgi:DNA-binding transcriptional LysR family regulator